jgi:hypothetical protein
MREEIPIEVQTREDGSIGVFAISAVGVAVPIGPVLHVNLLGESARTHATRIFAGSEPEAKEGRDLVASSLSRAEQLALDKMYAGSGTGREAINARALVLWAAMTIRALADYLATGDESVERRIESLVTLAGNEGVAPQKLVEPTPIMDSRQRRRKQRLAERVAGRVRSGRASDDVRDSISGREITLQPFRNRWAIFNEIGAGIAFTTFASAGSFVFLGVRLQKCEGVCKAGGITGFSASLDIIALVICSFGFLFATLSYANATGVLARLSTMNYEEALERGNRVSEYFGVYPLIFAIPLAVEGATSSPIPLIVKVVALVAFIGYHWSPRFSLLERVVADSASGSDMIRRCIVLVLVGLLGIAWFGPDIIDGDLGLWWRIAASGGFLLSICLIYGVAALIPEQESPSSYRVHREDILSEESPSYEDLRGAPDTESETIH